LQKTKNLKSKIERFNKLESEWEDLQTLAELGLEAQDESIIPEVSEGLKSLKDDFEKLRLETLLTGPYDKNNAILTLHAGAGGTEAQDWVQMLLRMYTRWSENKGFDVKTLDFLDGEEAGIKSVTIHIIGENAYGYLKSEKGVHRLVRISPFDASGRRHTSFASLDVMPELDDDIEVDINPDDLRIDTYRASGAGGQHINKTDSAIRITHIPTGVVVSCQTQRSQHQNKDTAMKMLKSKLLELKEREHKEKIEDLKGIQLDIAWGSQIRSYVFCPYTLAKDHRTNYEEGNINGVMDGNLDGFINAYLASITGNEKK
jgi:peptide chain release factor 2